MGTSFVKYLLAGAVMVMLYQNCSSTHTTSSELSSFQACNLIAKDEFANGYQKLMVENCAGCHAQGGSGNGYFADSNLDIAFDAFIVRGNKLVGDRAKDPNHQPPFSGLQHTEAVAELDTTWSAAQQQVDLCIANAGVSLGGDFEEGLIPEDPKPTQGNIETFVKLLEADKDTKTLTWNLESEIREPEGLSFPGAELTLDVQAITTSTGDKSYVFSNPTLTAGADSGLHIIYIGFKVNNELVQSATSYHSVNRRVPVGRRRNLGVGGTIFTYNIRATDVVSLSIGFLEPIEFDPKGFDELIATDGVFGVNCLSCHDGSSTTSTPQGGFDISTRQAVFNQIKVAPFSPNSSRVFIRMNAADPARGPMPQSGVLPEADLKEVLWWIQDGARATQGDDPN